MLGKKLKEIRLLRGYPQICVAKRTLINPSTLSKYESGIIEPNIQVLIKLAQFYQISLNKLLGLNNKNVPIRHKSKKYFDYIEKDLKELDK